MLPWALLAAPILLVAFIYLLYLFVQSQANKKSIKVPGLKPSSNEHGNTAEIGNAGSLHEFLLQLHKQFGSIASFWLGREQIISIASAKLFKEHQLVFDRPHSLFLLFEPMLSMKCIQYANGTDGRSRREHYDKVFTHDAIQNYYEKFHKITDEIIEKWNFSANGEHIPLGEHMFMFAIKISLWIIIGRKFHNENVVLDFKKNYDYAWAEMERRLIGDLPDTGSTRERQFNEAVMKCRQLISDCLDDAGKNPVKELLLLDVMLAHTEDRDMIVSDLIAYSIGGFHTTGNHLTWCFYYLASHKEIQDKLYREIRSVLGDEEMVTSRNINELKYLRQVIDETFRCAVVAPTAARYVDTDSELGGYQIPAKTPVVHALGVCLQDEKYWPHPEKFDPERFSKENLQRIPTLTYSPFGFAGKRMCPAYRFSYAELSVIIGGLINKFEVDLVEGQVVKPVFGLISHPAEEVWITVKKRCP